MKKGKNKHTVPYKRVMLLGIYLLFTSLVFAGPNEDAGIVFDLDPAYGNQNVISIGSQPAGTYIKVGVYCTGVHNLDTYSFEVEYDSNILTYITATATSSAYEPNILTTEGGTAVNWMVDTSTPGSVSCSYTLTGQDTTQAPEGEGLLGEIVFQAQSDNNTYMSFGDIWYYDSYAVGDEITSTELAWIGGVAPMPPSNLVAFNDTDIVYTNALCLRWVDPTENADGTPLTDLAGINVYFSDGTYITSVDPGVENCVVQGLTIGEVYVFYVTAYDSDSPANESMHSNTAGAVVVAPMPPDNLLIYSDYTTPTSIGFWWEDPTKNTDGTTLTDLNHIGIYYADGTLVASVDPGTETYMDTGLIDGQLYSYYVVAVADNGNASHPIAGSWHAGGSPIPSPPAGLRVDAQPGALVELTWWDPTTQEDGTYLDDLAGIKIYLDGTFHTSVDPGVEKYTFTDLIHGEYYTFYAVAYDDETPVHESQPSRTVECYNQTLFYVQPSSALDSIQVALDICTDYDTVLVAPGTYYENIEWPDLRIHFPGYYGWTPDDPNCYDYALGVKFVSESGPEVTIIDAGHQGYGIRIERNTYPEEFPVELDTTTVIEGFTFQNGQSYVTSGGIVKVGAGIDVSAPIMIKGNIMTDNNPQYLDWIDGAIYVGNASPHIIDNVITNTTGNGIYVMGLYYDGEVIIKNNTITQNSEYGIKNDDSGNLPLTITGNTITHNGSSGAWNVGGEAFENNVITDNGGYGINSVRFDDITNCIINNNALGGINGTSADIEGCTIANNGGIGITCSSSDITDCAIYNNQGDGVYFTGNGAIKYCDICQNTGFGVQNDSTNVTQARNNWWGDASGPGGAGPGTGDEVGEYVNYTPWKADPYFMTIISLPDYSHGEPGMTFPLQVSTSDITGKGVTSSEFALSYDSSVITAAGLDDSGTLVSGTDWSCQYYVVDDTVFVEMSGTNVLAGSGTLINLIFEVSEDAQIGQESPLHFCECLYNAGDIPVIIDDGIFIVGEIYGALEGTVTEAGKSPIQDAVVTAYGDPYTYCDTTDAAGYYSIPDVFYGLYEVSVTASAYNDYTTTGIIVLGGDTTEVNVEMTKPNMGVSPESITITLPRDTIYTTQITISNTGTGQLGYAISITDDKKYVQLGGVSSDDLSSVRDNKASADIDIMDGPWCIQSGDYAKELSTPSSKFEEEILHYDGENEYYVGLISGGAFEAAIRLTPTELTPYEGWELAGVLFAHTAEQANPGQVKIYRAGTSSEPGPLIASESFTADALSWFRIDLSEMLAIDITQDLWVSVEISGTSPMGMDEGPAVEGKGDFLYHGGEWDELYLLDYDYNVNVRAILALNWISVTPKTGTVLAGDSYEIDVEFDTRGLTVGGVYTTNIVISSDPDVGTITIPVILDIPVGVDDDPDVHSTHLHSNFPNPVAGNTTFSFSLKERSHVELSVYNIRGQLVETLIDGELDPADSYDVEWDCTAHNKRLSSGIYFYKLKTDSYDEVKKMLIVK